MKRFKGTKGDAKLIASSKKMLQALIEISECKGSYDTDRLKHCSNTVKDMAKLANVAIKEALDV